MLSTRATISTLPTVVRFMASPPFGIPGGKDTRTPARWRVARRGALGHSRCMWFRRKEPPAGRTGPEAVELHAIGFVRNAVARPRPRGWEKAASRVELLPEHALRLAGI